MSTRFFKRLWEDTCGQDLVEYALMAGFVFVAVLAIMPGVALSVKTIFIKVGLLIDGTTVVGAVQPIDPYSDDIVTWIQIAGVLLAVVFLGIIVLLRRRKNPE